MTINTTNSNVPEHLVGTRAGLFHLLRGEPTGPEEDSVVRTSLPRVIRQLRPKPARLGGRFGANEGDKIAKLLQEDEFCFNL